MPDQEYIYQDRIVAFIDVLGYKEKLDEFEKDAKPKETEEGNSILISEKVNEFINTFKRVTDGLEEQNIRYYLFSDNICITVDYVENPDLIVSLLFTINELFYSFAEIGYFLRGSIEVGKFIDEPKIALGVPLTKAYLAETKLAIYPRILISNDYYKLIQDYLAESDKTGLDGWMEDHLIYSSCELKFLNIFYNVIRKEDKVGFFSVMKQRIEGNLSMNNKKENIYVKYQWLANQYNRFLDIYNTKIIYTEAEEPDEETIILLKNLKIHKDAF